MRAVLSGLSSSKYACCSKCLIIIQICALFLVFYLFLSLCHPLPTNMRVFLSGLSLHHSNMRVVLSDFSLHHSNMRVFLSDLFLHHLNVSALLSCLSLHHSNMCVVLDVLSLHHSNMRVIRYIIQIWALFFLQHPNMGVAFSGLSLQPSLFEPI